MSKAASKYIKGLAPLSEFPTSFSSSMVWTGTAQGRSAKQEEEEEEEEEEGLRNAAVCKIKTGKRDRRETLVEKVLLANRRRHRHRHFL